MKGLLVLLCLVFDFGYIFFCVKKRFVVALLCKTLASACFLVLGYQGYCLRQDRFASYMVIGMAFDGLGDIFLGIRNLFLKKPMFLCGTFSFLLGHVFYAVAMFEMASSIIGYCISIAAIIVLCLYGHIKRLADNDKIYRCVGVVYVGMIMFIGILSMGLCLVDFNVSHLIMGIGSLMFVFSDMILIIYNFGERKEWMHPLYSALYYVGQSLIALSLHL